MQSYGVPASLESLDGCLPVYAPGVQMPGFLAAVRSKEVESSVSPGQRSTKLIQN